MLITTINLRINDTLDSLRTLSVQSSRYFDELSAALAHGTKSKARVAADHYLATSQQMADLYNQMDRLTELERRHLRQRRAICNYCRKVLPSQRGLAIHIGQLHENWHTS